MDKIISMIVGGVLAGVAVLGGTSAISAEGTKATAGDIKYADR